MTTVVWKTGHAIADRVADGIAKALPEAKVKHVTEPFEGDIHIGYGILRGMEDVFKEATRLRKPWFNVDRGYFRPNHFDGYYRVSLHNTQHTLPIVQLDNTGRIDHLQIDVLQWRGLNPNKPILVCPPTNYAIKFFGINLQEWLNKARGSAYLLGFNKWIIRPKGTETPLQQHLDECGCVLTFNSAVGWEALRQGIPVISDHQSMIGHICKDIPLDKLSAYQHKTRQNLFAAMSELQLTLDEMRHLLCPLMDRLISLSGMTKGKVHVPTSPRTLSAAEPETPSSLHS